MIFVRGGLTRVLQVTSAMIVVGSRNSRQLTMDLQFHWVIIRVNQFAVLVFLIFCFTFEKSLKLIDVLFVPKIGKNIVSGVCV